MSYNFLPNLIFLVAVLGILLLFVRRLPEAAELERRQAEEPAHEKLQAKGLPAEAFSKLRVGLTSLTKRAWNFILEAKDLKPHAAAGYRMKKLFGGKQPGQKPPQSLPPATAQVTRDEKYFLDQIKLQPKNLATYDALGKHYLEQQNFADAVDIYQYLVNHDPANSEYQARLGYCFYQNKNYSKAAFAYQKSLALDSTQPNRYYNLGLSLEAAGKLPEAVKNLEHAIVLEPAPKYYVSLSNTYLRMGHARKAKEALLKAKKLEPKNELVQAKLEKIAK